MTIDKAISILDEMLALEKIVAAAPLPDNAERIAAIEFAIKMLQKIEYIEKVWLKIFNDD